MTDEHTERRAIAVQKLLLDPSRNHMDEATEIVKAIIESDRAADVDIEQLQAEIVELQDDLIKAHRVIDKKEQRISGLENLAFQRLPFKIAELETQVRVKDEALLNMLKHSCVADAYPHDKRPEDKDAEDAARKALSNTTVKTEAEIRKECWLNVADGLDYDTNYLRTVGDFDLAQQIEEYANELRQWARSGDET